MASYKQAFTQLAQSLSTLSHDFSSVDSFRFVTKFCRDQWVIPAVFCVGYLAMVYATRRPMARHPYMALVDRLFALWNLGLSLFSCWGFYHMAVGLSHTAWNFGLQFTICAGTTDLVEGFQKGP
eukprot:CAMPEP_0206555318 /NCGR_PEP_ID=MMETSP0325_2-20121206/17714_1 /ASSEMBLY_ACC=CAM_ASM_000347 /TAXON_ID=2866 /ORGANISM="Crypthecodinium cohnii, Strain Seligo" /LENGTH=123 /DNA_ID=CAMNT_0054055579 /DNA_START=79 /DNA_END=446 /DNA_ORIENTATION=-